MATDKFPQLKELTLKAPNKGIISFVADGVIPMWSVVKIVAPASVGELPTVVVASTLNDPLVIGIATGGSGTPVNPDGTTGNAADAAGDIVDVAVLNSSVITKVVVDGSTIPFGSLVVASNTDGSAAIAGATTPVHWIGKMLQARTTTGDTLLIFLGGSS